MRPLLRWASVWTCLLLVGSSAHAWHHYHYYVAPGAPAGVAYAPVAGTAFVPTTASAAFVPTTTAAAAYVPTTASAAFVPTMTAAAAYVPTTAAYVPTASAAYMPVASAAFAPTASVASYGCSGGAGGAAGVAYVPVAVNPQQSAASAQSASGALGNLETLVPLLERLLSLRRPDSGDLGGDTSSLRRRLDSIDNRLDSLDRRLARLERGGGGGSLDDGQGGGGGVRLPHGQVPGRFGSSALGSAAEAGRPPSGQELLAATQRFGDTLDEIELGYNQRMAAYNALDPKTKATAAVKREKEALDKVRDFLKEQKRSVD